MKIKLNVEYCIASGACVLECPEVFGQDEQGMVVLLTDNPPRDVMDKVRKACSVCPTTVIEIEAEAGD